MQSLRSQLSLASSLLACCLATLACGATSPPAEQAAGSGGRGGTAAGGIPGTGGAIGTGGSDAGSGGEPTAAGTTSGGRSSGSGGSSSGGSRAGGAGGELSGRAGASGGDLSTTGGTAGAPETGGAPGQGGTGSGGTAGTGMGGGAGSAPKPPATPSTGCGEAAPELGSSTSPLSVSNHKYYVKLPTSYDVNTPSPLLFVFNGTGDPISWGELNAGFEGRNIIRVYPNPMSTSGWGAGDVPFFLPLYEQLTSQFCVDKSRVFAAGSDSGGTFASILGCEHASLLRGVAFSGAREPRAGTPDAAYPVDVTMRTCTAQVAAIAIHSPMDRIVSPEQGQKIRDFYRTLNHCGADTIQLQGSSSVSKCFQYQACDAGFPVYWCEHSDSTYADTYHGWPSFAGTLTWKIFSAY
jgi:polyhydroxybutyrate depolymerase